MNNKAVLRYYVSNTEGVLRIRIGTDHCITECSNEGCFTTALNIVFPKWSMYNNVKLDIVDRTIRMVEKNVDNTHKIHTYELEFENELSESLVNKLLSTFK
jgi:hypothetical protein